MNSASMSPDVAIESVIYKNYRLACILDENCALSCIIISQRLLLLLEVEIIKKMQFVVQLLSIIDLELQIRMWLLAKATVSFSSELEHLRVDDRLVVLLAIAENRRWYEDHVLFKRIVRELDPSLEIVDRANDAPAL